MDLDTQISKVGFMQGRLSQIIDGRIQSFPWANWELEFPLASEIGLHIMEWTLDQKDLKINPIMTIDGRKKIIQLCNEFKISIPSLTGDCFMQSPFWKAKGKEKESLEADFLSIIQSCRLLGIKYIVVPLVDNGSIENSTQLENLFLFFEKNKKTLEDSSVMLVFESDYKPSHLRKFISKLDKNLFGINYDIGNSSALGFNPEEEFFEYGNRIRNVHVKDRPLGGTTVPLGEGHANFPEVFNLLKKYSYSGNYILQTARSENDDHSSVLKTYKDFTQELIKLAN